MSDEKKGYRSVDKRRVPPDDPKARAKAASRAERIRNRVPVETGDLRPTVTFGEGEPVPLRNFKVSGADLAAELERDGPLDHAALLRAMLDQLGPVRHVEFGGRFMDPGPVLWGEGFRPYDDPRRRREAAKPKPMSADPGDDDLELPEGLIDVSGTNAVLKTACGAVQYINVEPTHEMYRVALRESPAPAFVSVNEPLTASVAYRYRDFRYEGERDETGRRIFREVLR
jgi:hypothetical protein